MAPVSSHRCSSTSDAMMRSNGGVGERQPQRVAVDLAAGRVGGDLARLDHRPTSGPHLLQLGRVVVERDDGRAASHRRERVTPAAAPHVEQALALAEVEAVEVDGQHQATPGRPRAGVEQGAVVLDRADGGCAPGELVEHAGATRGADAGAQVGVAQGAQQHVRERVGVTGRDQEPGLTVGADDLGQRAARRGDQRHAARHRLDRRAARSPRRATARPRPRPRRRARRCARWSRRTRSAPRPVSPRRSMSAGILLLPLGLPMMTSSASSRSVRTLASASSSGTRPFIGTSELAVVMSRPGTRAISGIGRKIAGSTPTGTMCSRSARGRPSA